MSNTTLPHSRGGIRQWRSKPSQRIDPTGLRQGSLTVLSSAGTDGRNSLWLVRCDCGKESVISSQVLRWGRSRAKVFCSRQCPLLGAHIRDRRRGHGKSQHPAYAVWRSMKARCLNPKHQAWKNYGGRGIKVCPQWLESFDQFWEDMGPTYIPGRDLDRADNNGGYSKENCRWVTRKENVRNTRKSWVTRSGAPQNLMELAEKSGVSRSTLYYRLNAGVPWEIAATGAPDCSRAFQSTISSTRAPSTDSPSGDLPMDPS